jgi:hypothetical protein
MSFLSRRSSRAGKRNDKGAPDAGRGRDDREYDDDGYPQDDDNWSPDQYFSPEGIKGRRASVQHGGPPAGPRDPGPRDPSRRDPGRGYDGYDAEPPGNGYSTGPQPQGRRGQRAPAGYGRDSYQQQQPGYDQQSGYDQQPGYNGYDPQDEDDPGERGARGKRRERGERRRPRLGRRDRDGEIWPDDGVSDEDYWASVAADRPLPGAGSGPEADATQVMGSHAGPVPGRPTGGYPGNESRPGSPGTHGGNGSRTGRLGAPPGLSGPYPSGGGNGRNSGPMPRPGTAQGPGRPSFQPSDARFDATERFDRIDRPLAAYTDPRMNSRGQDRRPSEQRPPEQRANGRHSAGRGGSDEDPLTSKAFSRDAMAAADARSYRAAASRQPPVPPDRYEAALNEQTQTFTTNGQYSDPQAPTARYPVRGQPSQQQPSPQRSPLPPGGPPGGQRSAPDRRPSYPYPEQQSYPRRPAPGRDDDQHGRPAPGRHAGYGRGDGRGGDDARRGNGRY